MNIIHVNLPRFEQLANLVSCHELTDNRVKDIVKIKGKDFVMTGSVGTGRGGTEYVIGYQVLPIDKYHGKLKPLFYIDHHYRVRKKQRARAYTGMMFNYRRQRYVFVGERIQFKPVDNEIQKTLF